MNAYTAHMVMHIAEEIKSIEDPCILNIYLTAILYQRCRIGGAKEGTCKNCLYQNYHCRQLLEISRVETQMLDEEEETK